MRIVAPIPKNPDSKAKFAKKQTFFCTAILHPLKAKVFKLLLIITFKDSKNLQSLDIGLQEMGAKRRLNKVNK